MKDRFKVNPFSQLRVGSHLQDQLTISPKGILTIKDEQGNVVLHKRNKVVQNAVNLLLAMMSNQPNKGISKLLLGTGGTDSDDNPIPPSCSDTGLVEPKLELPVLDYQIDQVNKAITFNFYLDKDTGNSGEGTPVKYSEFALADANNNIFARITDYPLYKTNTKAYTLHWTIILDLTCQE